MSILSSDLMVLATNGSDSLQVGSRPTISKESTKILQGLTDNQEVFFEAMRKHHGFNQMVFAKKVPGYPFILLVSKPKYFWADYAYISIIFFILIISFVIALLMKNTVLLSKLLSQNDHYFKLALHDELTGILNRRGFEKNTKQVLESAKQDPISISAVLFDIDYFKQINDTYGHDKGDEVLRRFTRVCQDHITHSDVFARLGGDEFVMLLPNKNGQEATQSISELLDKIRMIRVETPLGEVNISSSIGISEVRSSKESIAKWLDRADKALYQAKNKGRNCVVLKV
ncbi:GGDEF domain-containing protein [Aliivibrio sifiae]|uniref:GGDEF domain-containing protein n=1 Tax=Aliivibrio sifiae TaxID=566293 RepID=UPI003D10342A